MPLPPKLTRSGKKTSPFTIQITYRVFVLTMRIFFLPESCFPSGVSKKGEGHLFCLVVVSDFWTWFGPLHQFLSCCVSGVFSICLMTTLVPRPGGCPTPSQLRCLFFLPVPRSTCLTSLLLDHAGAGVFGMPLNLLHHSPLSWRGQPP